MHFKLRRLRGSQLQLLFHNILAIFKLDIRLNANYQAQRYNPSMRRYKQTSHPTLKRIAQMNINEIRPALAPADVTLPAKSYIHAIADLRQLLRQLGRAEFRRFGYTSQLRRYRRLLAERTIRLGAHVAVSPDQARLGPAKFPNRTGVVTGENRLGREHGGLWYVSLFATKRAGARTETFWGDDLIPWVS